MAPTQQKPTITREGEQILDLVVSYIQDVEDLNSLSLVSRKLYENVGIMRKSLTVHTYYYPNPSRLNRTFPFMETLTLKGAPSDTNGTYHFDIGITPWIEQLAIGFRSLKELHICHMVVHDEDLETLARTRGKELRSLKIKKCQGFSTNGLRHVSKYCNQLRNLCLKDCYHIEVEDGNWLHQLALTSTVLEKLHVTNMGISCTKDLTLLAKNCSNSLISLKIGRCYLNKLRDAFRYAVRLEHFGGYMCDEESDLVGFQFPLNISSLSIKSFTVTQVSTVLPFLNQIKKLELVFLKCHCLFLKKCPNLEVLNTEDACGDTGWQVTGQFCKKLRKLTHCRPVTSMGLIALAKECTNLESLEVRLEYISNGSIEFLGTHLKNLRKFRMQLVNQDGITNEPSLDDGIRAMLISCNKLERLDICLWQGGLTDVGLEYIGKFGRNLRFLSLTHIGKSDVGLTMLSNGCPKLRKLKLMDCPFSKQAATSLVFNMPSLRYVWVYGSDGAVMALTRPEFQFQL